MVTLNSEHLPRRLFESFRAAGLEGIVEARVVVVDNGALLTAIRLPLYCRLHGRLPALIVHLLRMVRKGPRALIVNPTSRAALRVLPDRRRRRAAPRGPSWLQAG